MQRLKKQVRQQLEIRLSIFGSGFPMNLAKREKELKET